MSWGLFIGGIMTGLLAVLIVVEKIKYDTAEHEREIKKVNELPVVHKPVSVPCMTEEEFNTKMDALFEIFAIKEGVK